MHARRARIMYLVLLLVTALFTWIAAPSVRVGVLRVIAVSLRPSFLAAWNGVASVNRAVVYGAVGIDFRGSRQESAGNQGHHDPHANRRHQLIVFKNLQTVLQYLYIIKL